MAYGTNSADATLLSLILENSANGYIVNSDGGQIFSVFCERDKVFQVELIFNFMMQQTTVVAKTV